MLRVLLVALCAGGAVLAGCGEDLTTFDEPPKRIEVDAGERFALDFTINPSIGWDWRLVEDPAGAVVLEDTETEIDEPDAAGSGGTKRFVFEAKESGSVVLRFERDYRGEKIDDRHRATVVVR